MNGSFDTVLVATNSRFSTDEFMELVMGDKVVLACLWPVLFVGDIALSTWKHKVPPNCYLGLLSDCDEKKAYWGRRLETCMKVVERLEIRAAEGDKKTTEYIRAMEWPLNGWSRENMSIMSEVGFDVDALYEWFLKRSMHTAMHTTQVC